MKNIKYLFAGILVAGLLSSCLKEFQELNTNVDQNDRALPVQVFTGATRYFNNASRSHLTTKYGHMVYMQYVVGQGGASAENYAIANNTAGTRHPELSALWYSDFYTVNGDSQAGFGLRLNYLVNKVIPAEDNPEIYNDLSAISTILYTYKEWMILDSYGAAPLTEAFQVYEGNYTPRYDLYQESVDGEPMYKVLDAQLKEAVATLKASDDTQVKLGNNDFFYKGDVNKWIKAANTIRVKMAQRVEKRDNAFFNEVVADVLTSRDNIIAAQDESLISWEPYDYNNAIDDINALTNNYVASAAFVNFLTAHNDPRLAIMVRKNGFGDHNNNAENDEWWETFSTNYPDNKVKRTVEGQEISLDLNTFADNRYMGMTASTSFNNEKITGLYIGGNLTNIPIKDEEGNDQNMSIRMYSQFESRYFVKNGGAIGKNGTRYIEDEKYVISTPNDIHSFTPILTYPETCFMLAEIALKKGTVAGQGADAWFKEGIKAAMKQVAAWAERMYVPSQMNSASDNYAPVDDAAIDAYLAQPEFQTATLEKIISQQWVNLFMQPAEMWATWKRTGLPAFKESELTGTDGIVLGPKSEGGVAYFEALTNEAVASIVIPRRNSLPVPNTLNLDNYNAAVEKLKEDPQYGTSYNSTEGRVWWDVE